MGTSLFPRLEWRIFGTSLHPGLKWHIDSTSKKQKEKRKKEKEKTLQLLLIHNFSFGQLESLKPKVREFLKKNMDEDVYMSLGQLALSLDKDDIKKMSKKAFRYSRAETGDEGMGTRLAFSKACDNFLMTANNQCRAQIEGGGV